MDIGPLTVETHPTPADVQFLEDRLHEYNEAQTGITGIIICGNGSSKGRHAVCFESADQQQRWQAKTQVLMTEMVALLHWICARLAQPTPLVPVPLLRDTPLVHLGLIWLRRFGVPVPASKPLIIGRTFADLSGDGRGIHGALGNVMYRVLMEDRPRDLATLRRHFATTVHADPAIPASFTQACRDYLATLALDGTPLFIESGVQGTFPLFLLSLTGNTGEMVFYTTTPWLYLTYEQIVFRKNYNYLRDMETIVAHDYLFQFKAVQDGKVLVEETMNERARRLALLTLSSSVLERDLVFSNFNSAAFSLDCTSIGFIGIPFSK